MTVILAEHAAELLQSALSSRPGQDPAEIVETALVSFLEKGSGQYEGKLTPDEAVADIRELRKGITLGGLQIRDLIVEGRKY